MITEYELYSDERSLRVDGANHLFLEGLTCTDKGRERLLANLRIARENHGLGGEIKWGKASQRHLNAYRAYQ